MISDTENHKPFAEQTFGEQRRTIGAVSLKLALGCALASNPIMPKEQAIQVDGLLYSEKLDQDVEIALENLRSLGIISDDYMTLCPKTLLNWRDAQPSITNITSWQRRNALQRYRNKARKEVRGSITSQPENPVIPTTEYAISDDGLVLLKATSPALLDLVRIDYQFVTELFPNLPLFFDLFGTDPIHWGVLVNPDEQSMNVDSRSFCIYHDFTKGWNRMPIARQAFHETQHTVSTSITHGMIGDEAIELFFPPEILLPLARCETEIIRRFYEEMVVGEEGGFARYDNQEEFREWALHNENHSLNEFLSKLSQLIAGRILKEGFSEQSEADAVLLSELESYLNANGVKVEQLRPFIIDFQYDAMDEVIKVEAVRIGRYIETFLRMRIQTTGNLSQSTILTERAARLQSSLYEVTADIFNRFFTPLANDVSLRVLLGSLPDEIVEYLVLYERLLRYNNGFDFHLTNRASLFFTARKYLQNLDLAIKKYREGYKAVVVEIESKLSVLESMIEKDKLDLFLSLNSLRAVLVNKSATRFNRNDFFSQFAVASRACVLLNVITENLKRVSSVWVAEEDKQEIKGAYLQLLPVLNKLSEYEVMFTKDLVSPNSSIETDNPAEQAYLSLAAFYREIMSYVESVNKIVVGKQREALTPELLSLPSNLLLRIEAQIGTY
jgi:hypothetical protein